MNRQNLFSLFVVTGLGFTLLPDSAVSQTKSLKEQITGTWTLISNDNIRPDGSKTQLFGAKPKGVLMLNSDGTFAQIYLRPDVPKFKSNNRLEGTAEENKAVVQATSAQFGTWSVDEAGKTLIVHIDGNFYPNLAGTESTRSVTLSGDELRVSNPAPGAGGKTESVLKRVK